MASEETIATCFYAMIDNGVPTPPSWAADRAAASGRVLQTWRAAFADVPDGILQAAVMAWLTSREARFWPTPGAILAHVEKLAPSGPVLLDADQAWGHLCRMISRHGSYSPPGLPADRFGPGWTLHEDADQCAALTAALAAIGGWAAACARELDDVAQPAAFRRAYQAHVGRAANDRDTARVLGALEARRGPRLITGGDK